jgi:hypothetical protein
MRILTIDYLDALRRDPLHVSARAQLGVKVTARSFCTPEELNAWLDESGYSDWRYIAEDQAIDEARWGMSLAKARWLLGSPGRDGDDDDYDDG